MNKKIREKYKALLVEMKEKLLKDIDHIQSENLNTSQRESSGDLSGYGLHMADVGTDNYDREFVLNRIVSNEQDILYAIDQALLKIEEGAFGVCEMCESEISERRLDAVPYAKLCLPCQERNEKKRKHRESL